MSALPWYRWFPGDFHGDAKVRLLSPEARGAYRDLLDMSWELGAIEDPVRVLLSVGWLHADAERLWEEMRPCWQLNGSGWVQARLEGEREDAAKRHERASRASRSRWSDA